MSELEVVVTDEAQIQLSHITSKVDQSAVKHALLSLKVIAEAGHSYDPVYEAALPPVECRVIYAGNYGIYYFIDHYSRVVILAIEDQRADPRKRFSLF